MLDALKNLLRRCIHAFAVVGHRDAPSGAVEERNAKRLLEDRDALADESRRRAQLQGCRSETDLASRQAEYAQVVELEFEAHDS